VAGRSVVAIDPPAILSPRLDKFSICYHGLRRGLNYCAAGAWLAADGVALFRSARILILCLLQPIY